MNKEKNGLSTASFVLGIIGIITSFIPIVNNVSLILGALSIIFAIILLVKKVCKTKAIISLILGILSIVITITLQNSWSNSLNEISDDIDTATGANTEKVLKDVDISMGSFEAFIDEYGFAETKLVVKITNKTNELKSFDFTIEAISPDGTRIDVDYIYATKLEAGQSQTFKIFEYVNDEDLELMKSATFKVVEASMY